jgi:hypothetical protein
MRAHVSENVHASRDAALKICDFANEPRCTTPARPRGLRVSGVRAEARTNGSLVDPALAAQTHAISL